jgi:hypothetical protein
VPTHSQLAPDSAKSSEGQFESTKRNHMTFTFHLGSQIFGFLPDENRVESRMSLIRGKGPN